MAYVTASESGRAEVLVSVDIETSGQSPSVGSMLSIGACRVDRSEVGVYLELQPLPDRGWDESAVAIHGLTKERLGREGLEPGVAMERLEAWLVEIADGAKPIFVGFNAPFDWMFVADYFWRYLGRNPFGISALDLKSYFMGSEGVDRWELTRRLYIDERLALEPDHSHHALEDAQGQAALARAMFERNASSVDG